MRIVVPAVLCAVLAGCYSDRYMGNYDATAELHVGADGSAVVEEAETDSDAIARNEDRLRKLEAEKEPVYRMNAGDQIEIRVYDHPDIGMKTRIGPDGTVGMAFVGQVKLSGKTIAEGADYIHNGLLPYVKNPVVSITILDVQSETATIAGSCSKPGVYSISQSTRLADFYAMAGSSANRLFNGVDVDVADLDNSMFVRNGEIVPVNFHKAIDRCDPIHNIHIRKGDYVFIAQRMEASVTICGEVAHPHKRLFETGMGLIETLTSAGWMKESHWKYVIIIRDGLANPKFYKVDVDGILAGKSKNVALKPSDIIYVPKDNMSEYNVFVRKLLPTAQLIGLIASPFSSLNKVID